MDNDVAGAAGASPAPVGDDVIDVIALDDLPRGRTCLIYRFRRSLLLYRVDMQVRAFKAYCPHQGMELMESGIRGNSVTCSRHGWRFELPSGSCDRGERWGLAELRTQVIDGRVIVHWQE